VRTAEHRALPIYIYPIPLLKTEGALKRGAYLPYSNIWLSISIDKWLRPDVNADQVVLRPDMLVNPDEALEVALEYLHNLGN